MVRNTIIAIFIYGILIGCGADNMKFEWKASESAPANYPMQIVRGNFFLADGGNLYIPDGKIINSGWGNFVSTHVLNENNHSLPEHLKIAFFSYIENEFYVGEFDLPLKQIEDYFKEGYVLNNESQNYTRIVVGVAPLGVVSVWLAGQDKRVEVFSGIAENADLDWSLINKNPDLERNVLVEKRLYSRLSKQLENASIEQIKAYLTKYGEPPWVVYRQFYYWKTEFSSVKPLKQLIKVKHIDGSENFSSLDQQSNLISKEPIPKQIYFELKNSADIVYGINIFLDKDELINKFNEIELESKISIDNPVIFEFDLSAFDTSKKIRMTMKNNGKIIQLNKLRTESFRLVR